MGGCHNDQTMLHCYSDMTNLKISGYAYIMDTTIIKLYMCTVVIITKLCYTAVMIWQILK